MTKTQTVKTLLKSGKECSICSHVITHGVVVNSAYCELSELSVDIKATRRNCKNWSLK